MSPTNRPEWQELPRRGCTENFSRSTIKADVDALSGLLGSPAHPSPDPVFKCGRVGFLVTGGFPNLGDSTIHFIDIQSRTGVLDLRVFAAELQLLGVGGTNNSCKHRSCKNSNGPHSSGTDVQ